MCRASALDRGGEARHRTAAFRNQRAHLRLDPVIELLLQRLVRHFVGDRTDDSRRHAQKERNEGDEAGGRAPEAVQHHSARST